MRIAHGGEAINGCADPPPPQEVGPTSSEGTAGSPWSKMTGKASQKARLSRRITPKTAQIGKAKKRGLGGG